MKKKMIGSVKLLSCFITAGMLAVFSACGNNDMTTSGSQVESSAETSVESSVPEGTAEESSVEDNSSQEAGDGIEDGTRLSDMVSGQITAIEGMTITLDLAEMPEPAEGNGSMDRTDLAEPDKRMVKPDGEGGTQQSGEDLAEAGKTEGAPDGTPDNAVRLPEGEAQAGEALAEAPQMDFKLTGETRTITVTENTVITLNGEAAVLEDLSVGDRIMAIMNEDVVESISAQTMEQ